MTRSLFAVLMASAFMCVSSSAFAASVVTDMKTKLDADPKVYKGSCPTTITFNGSITVEGTIDPAAPVQIGYQFLRSDNATGPIHYYTITAPGTQTVSDTWQLGLDYEGWQQLKAWPTGHQGGYGYSFSKQAKFKLNCKS